MAEKLETTTKRSKFLKRAVEALPLGLSVVALPFAVAAFILALSAGSTNVYETGSLDSQEAADVAARALTVAEQNNESVGVILSFLEGGFALLGLIIAVAASVFIVNLRDIRGDLEARAGASEQHVETTLKLRETELDRLGHELEEVVERTNKQITDLTDSTRQRIAELTAQIADQLDEARLKAENAFRVLSLQLLAEQQVRARNYETAILSLQEAYELDAENQTTNYLLGYLYTARRKFEQAQEHLTRALRVNPDFAPALAAMGLTQRRIGDQFQDDFDTRNRYWAQAESNLIRALDMDHGMIDADGESYYGTLGGLYRRQDRFDDAIRAYERAVKVTPTSSYPVSNLALLYKYTGREQEAPAMFERTKEIAEAILDDHPSDYWARIDLAQALLVLGQSTEALAQYRDVIGRQPSITVLRAGLDTLQFLSRAPKPISRIDEAIQSLQTAITAREAEEKG
jgi:tetratricopeptide (TPR) repeat protein